MLCERIDRKPVAIFPALTLEHYRAVAGEHDGLHFFVLSGATRAFRDRARRYLQGELDRSGNVTLLVDVEEAKPVILAPVCWN
jgi:hypothetical protein